MATECDPPDDSTVHGRSTDVGAVRLVSVVSPTCPTELAPQPHRNIGPHPDNTTAATSTTIGATNQRAELDARRRDPSFAGAPSAGRAPVDVRSPTTCSWRCSSAIGRARDGADDGGGCAGRRGSVTGRPLEPRGSRRRGRRPRGDGSGSTTVRPSSAPGSAGTSARWSRC